MTSATNVVLLTVDCLRFDRCGFNGAGKDLTPTLDALAADSVVFDRAIAPGPRTSESVPGILSGRLSAECNYTGRLGYKTIPNDAETLATWMSREGYRTVGVVSNPQLSPNRNFHAGFDSFKNLRIRQEGDRFESAESSKEDNQSGRDRSKLVSAVRDSLNREHSSAVLKTLQTASVIVYRTRQRYRRWPTVAGRTVVSELLDDLPSEGNEPFFAWTHLNDLHSPLHPGRVRQGGLIDASDVAQFRADVRRMRHEVTPLYEAMYDSTVRYIDAVIETALDRLREQGRFDNTAVILTADHGEALYDRGIYGHAAGNERRLYESDRDYLYPELLRVPLLVHPPGGATNPRRRSSPFSLLWLHEVVASVAGLTPGSFPRTSGINYPLSDTSTDIQPVISDSLTADGHTIAARDSTSTVMTSGATPAAPNQEAWRQFGTCDEGQRISTPAADGPLTAVCRKILTNPQDLKQAAGDINRDTQQMLSDLGYL